MLKRKRHDNELFTVPQDLMENYPTGSKVGKGFAKGKSVVHRTYLRFIDYLLRHCHFEQLDKALTYKLGKPPTKSLQARRVAKAYNEGVQDTISKLKQRGFWL